MNERRTPEQRLAALRDRKEKTEARIAAIEARTKHSAAQLETRRAIVLGKIVMADMARGVPGLDDYLRETLRRHLTYRDQPLFVDFLKGGTL